MLRDLNHKLSKLPTWQITGLAIASLGLIAYLDYITGYEISVAFFYVGPIVLVTWYMGSKAGFAISFLSGLLLLVINIASLHVYSHPAIRYWNTCLDLMGYYTITFLVSKLNENINSLEQQRDQLDELAEDRERAYKQLTELSAHLTKSVEQERHKISREIHDDLGGNLTAIKMGIASLAGQIDRKEPALIEKTQYLEFIVDRTFEMVHRISSDLRPNILGLGIVNAIEWQANEFDQHMGIPCNFIASDENIALDEEKTMVLFRVCQEALSNIAKHAKANLVTIKLTRFADEINMQISDDGIGITAEDQHKKNAFGIHGMFERVISLNGSFSIQPGTKNGTVIMVKLPE